jgi:hypothetical protein
MRASTVDTRNVWNRSFQKPPVPSKRCPCRRTDAASLIDEHRRRFGETLLLIRASTSRPSTSAAAVDVVVRRWLDQNRLAPSDATELRERLTGLQALYQRHIMVEDQRLFPAAARALDDAQLRQIGEEMAARRDIRSNIVW